MALYTACCSKDDDAVSRLLTDNENAKVERFPLALIYNRDEFPEMDRHILHMLINAAVTPGPYGNDMTMANNCIRSVIDDAELLSVALTPMKISKPSKKDFTSCNKCSTAVSSPTS
jgi:hypothetical protein